MSTSEIDDAYWCLEPILGSRPRQYVRCFERLLSKVTVYQKNYPSPQPYISRGVHKTLEGILPIRYETVTLPPPD